MSNSLYLISIDPGSNTGVGVFELDSATLAIKNVSSFVVVLDKYLKTNEEIIVVRNRILANVCSKLSEIYKPNVVAMESAFLNSRFPKAVMQLSQYTSTVEQSFYSRNSFVKLYRYPPKYIKKHIGGGGGADKDAMLVAVSKIPELSTRICLNRVTEHEIDALAVGYITVVGLRNSPHELISY